MKGKILIIFFVALFCLSSIPYVTNTVSAVSIAYSFGFEGTALGGNITAGLPVASGNIFTSKISGAWSTAFSVQSSGVRSGSRCFYTFDRHGWFNATYSISSYLTEFTTYLMITGTASCSLTFYNNTQGIGHPAVYMVWSYSPAQWMYYDSVGSAQLIASCMGGSYNKVGFDIYNELGDCRYYFDSTVVSGTLRYPDTVTSNKRIDRIYLTNNGDYMRYDDMNFTLSGTYENTTGGTNPEHDFSIYKTIGSFPDVTASSVGDYTENEGRYDIPFTGTVRGIDIFSANTFSSNWSYIWNLQIGGIACAPTTFYNYSYGSSSVCTAIRFDFIDTPISFDNEKIVIEVRNPCKNPYSGYYYQVMYSDSSTWRGTADIDLDGDTQAYKSNNPPNGVYDGSFLISNSEFFYVIYYEGGIGGNPEEETDYNFLTISGNNMNFNATGSPLFTVNDTVVIGWGISDLTVDNYITIEYEGTEITTGGFPYTIYNAKGSYGFSPENSGNYTVYLYCDDVLVRTKNFTVIEETNPEFILYSVHTTPPITYDFQTYWVKYSCYNPVGHECYVAMFRSSQDSSNFSNNLYNREIDNNVTGEFIYTPSASNYNQYWQVFVRVGSSYVPKGKLHNHGIIQSGKVSSLGLNRNTIPVNYPLTVYGTQPYLFDEVWIYVNNYRWINVGESQDFTKIYTPTKAGTLTFELFLVLSNGTKILLCPSVTCQVTTNDTTPEPPSGLDMLPPPFSYIAGAIVTLMFVIAPVVLIGKLGIENSIMQYIPIFTGLVGFILSCLVGFFPWYAIFGLVLILVLVIVVMWQRNKG